MRRDGCSSHETTGDNNNNNNANIQPASLDLRAGPPDSEREESSQGAPEGPIPQLRVISAKMLMTEKGVRQVRLEQRSQKAETGPGMGEVVPLHSQQLQLLPRNLLQHLSDRSKPHVSDTSTV